MILVIVPSVLFEQPKCTSTEHQHVNITCLECKRHAEIHETIFKLLTMVLKHNVEERVYVCEDCMENRTDSAADKFVEKAVFRNANLN